MKKTLEEQVAFFMVAVCLGRLFTWINIARQRVCEIYLRGTKSPDQAIGCLEELL